MATTHRITRSGNLIDVQFDGKSIGMLQNLRPSDSYGHQPASGVGDIHVQEYVPSMAEHRLTASTMVLFENNLRSQGIAMENGDDVLRGLVFDIVIFGKTADEGILRKYTKCSYTGGDVEISKHAIVVTNAQFVALDVTGKSL